MDRMKRGAVQELRFAQQQPAVTLKSIIALCALASLAPLAQAKSCSAHGNLRFLGATTDSAHSVWLSATSAGAFRLDSAQGNQTVDSWSKNRRGLHLSLSPNVSNGNGGTHKLYDDSGGCLLDTQNQVGGFVLPPNFIPPTVNRPPIGGPTGLMPTRPPMPTLPGGVTPPIGTLPPTGLMPTLPGGVTPPIGTLPPTGLMPTMPGGVTPPIGTLPPDGLVPISPGDAELTLAAAQPYPAGVRCPPGTFEDSSMPELDVGRCRRLDEQSAAQPGRSEAPITPGRDLLEDTQWNSWVDTSYSRIRDRRDNQDLDGSGGVVLLGADRRVDDAMVAGMMLSLENSRTDAYGGEQQVDVNGFMVGPYMAYQLSPAWSLYANLNLGHFNQDQQLSTLSGSGDVQRYALTLNAQGQYALDDAVYLRPKLLLSYLHSSSEAYELRGAIDGSAIRLRLPESSYNLGGFQPSLEISRQVELADGSVFVPYAELGVNYAFERPDSEPLLVAGSGADDPSRFSGLMRLGARTLIGESSMLDFNSSYQSLGTPGLDVWEAELLFSHAF